MDEISKVSFKFRAGEVLLGSIDRKLVTRSKSPFTEDSGVLEREPTPDRLPMDADGLLMRSASIERPLPKIQMGRDWIRYVPRQYQRYFADLRLTYEEYLNAFSSKSRSTLRRKVRRFEKESGGGIWWKRYQTPEEMEAFHAIAREVSRESYQERLLDAGLPASEEFRRTMMDFAREGNVRGYVTFVESRPAAYLFCPVRQGVVCDCYVGLRAGDEVI
jgi:hypothetical protein